RRKHEAATRRRRDRARAARRRRVRAGAVAGEERQDGCCQLRIQNCSMTKVIRVATVITAITVVTFVAFAQEQLPRFRSGANLVSVDAYFSKNGTAVTDLKQDEI